MEYCLIGPGAVGLLLGSYIHKATGMPVRLVVRSRRHDDALRGGVRLTGLVESWYPAEPRLPGGGVECGSALVTVKAPGFEWALDAALRIGVESMLVVTNGLGLVEEAARHGMRAWHGAAGFGVERLDYSTVRVNGLGPLSAGPVRGYSVGKPEVVSVLEAGGAQVEVYDDIEPVRWLKASVNAALNPVAALARVRNGAVLENSMLWSVASRAAREAGAVAEALGISLPGDPVEALRRTIEATRSNVNSMLADLLACRVTEVEWINGYIYRRAGEAGVNADTVGILYMLVKGLEETCGAETWKVRSRSGEY